MDDDAALPLGKRCGRDVGVSVGVGVGVEFGMAVDVAGEMRFHMGSSIFSAEKAVEKRKGWTAHAPFRQGQSRPATRDAIGMESGVGIGNRKNWLREQ
jgi:hypothetical protein